MMPWRDQLKLGWYIIRQMCWPSQFPAWANTVVWIASAEAIIGVFLGTLWPLAGAIVIDVITGWVIGGKQKS